tara:strand:+ start:2785 stop:3045 length:261 start_codon:yes stop_codon:yes gene_type:complete
MINTSPNIINKCLIASMIAVLLNILSSFSVLPFATSEQIVPTYGVESLSYFSQIVHLLTIKNRAIIASCINTFIIVFVSVNMALTL